MDVTLSYAPATPKRKLKRWAGRAIAFCALCVLATVAWKVYPEAARRCSVLYWQHRVLSAKAAPIEAYRFIPIPLDKAGSPQAGALTCPGGTWAMLGPDPKWAQFRQACGSPLASGDSDVYVHSITDPHGNQFIVAVHIMFIWGRVHSPRLEVEVVKPGTLFEYPSPAAVTARTFEFDNNPTEILYPQFSFRVLTGQPDPADASHFTIDYDLNGQRHTLDGYIDDQDVLKIEKRKEPATQPLPSLPGQSQ